MNKPDFGHKSGFSAAKDITGESGIISFKYAFKGVLFAYVLSVFLLLISSVLITYSPIPDSFIGLIVKLTIIVSVTYAGRRVAKRSGQHGWLTGAVTGLLYTVLLYIIGSLATVNFTITGSTLTSVVLGFAFGALGGIWGINSKSKYKRRR